MGEFHNLIESIVGEFVHTYVFNAFEIASKKPLFSSPNKEESNFNSELVKLISEDMQIDEEMIMSIYHPVHWNLITNQTNSPLELYPNGRNDVLYIRPSRNYTLEEKEELSQRILEKEGQLLANKLELFLTPQRLPAYQV